MEKWLKGTGIDIKFLYFDCSFIYIYLLNFFLSFLAPVLYYGIIFFSISAPILGPFCFQFSILLYAIGPKFSLFIFIPMCRLIIGTWKQKIVIFQKKADNLLDYISWDLLKNDEKNIILTNVKYRSSNLILIFTVSSPATSEGVFFYVFTNWWVDIIYPTFS